MSDRNNELFNDSTEIFDAMRNLPQLPQNFNPRDVHVETKNTQMITLINRIENDEIELNPAFQRRPDVWKEDQQSRLIESMMLNIPLPAFYMDASDNDKWIVIDGLQRLNTIKRFVILENLTLGGLGIMGEYNGYKFSALPKDLQRRIKETDVVIYQIKEGTPEVVRYEIFNRINKGGTQLKRMEIIVALHTGLFVDFLEKLAGSKNDEEGKAHEGKEFIAATCEGVSKDRKDDQECVLRFMAFNFLPPEFYRTDDFLMFLHRAMDVGNRLSEQKQSEYAGRFLRAMDVSRRIFKDKAFRKFYKNDTKRSPVNKALFEAVSVNISNLSFEQQELLVNRRKHVIESMRKLIANDKIFEDSITQGTGSAKKVRYRFAAVKNMLMEILNAE